MLFATGTVLYLAFLNDFSWNSEDESSMELTAMDSSSLLMEFDVDDFYSIILIGL